MLLILLFSVIQLQLASSTRNFGADCRNENYVSSYDENVGTGLKVLDALRAQTQAIDQNATGVSIKCCMLIIGQDLHKRPVQDFYVSITIIL